VPDLLEVLRVVAACLGGVSDGLGIESAVGRDLDSQVDVLLSAVVRVALQMIDAESETGMPLDRTWESASRILHDRAAIAWIENQCLDVTVEPERSVNLRLDVAIHGIEAVGLGQFDEREAGRDAEGGGFGRAVWVAERGPGEGVGGEPEV
jgi:hypothetical protein